MSEADEAYVGALRDAFDRYLAAVVRPLLTQARDLKAALQAERRRAIAGDTNGGIRRELGMLEAPRDKAAETAVYGVPLMDFTRDELLGVVVMLGERYTRELWARPKL